MAIWVIKDGQREGPYEEQDVRELIYEGTYSDADAAIRDGQFDWSTLGQLLGRRQTPAEPAFPEPGPTSVAEPAPPPEPAAVLATPEPEPEPPPMPAAPPEPPGGAPVPAPVVVVDFQMPFGSMVIFMVKWAIASIPALLILAAIAATFWGIFISVVALLLRH